MKIFGLLLGLGLLVLLVAGGFAFWMQNSLTTPKEHDKAETYITIDKGSTPSQIVAKLAVEGILDSSPATLIYLKTLGNPAALKAGDYKFPSPITPLQVLALLEKGEERSTRLVIPKDSRVSISQSGSPRSSLSKSLKRSRKYLP
jgi:UPF0755 protein